MKRIITYISILAAALTAGVSCSRDLSFDENQDGGNLTLVFRTEQMGTRVTVNDADPIKGVGAENTIEHIDYFFFPDDNPTSTAMVSGRLTVDKLTKVSDTEYKYDGFDTNLSDYASLKGPSYLYVLANYPGEVTVKTMKQLLALPISTDFKKEQTSFVMDTYDSAKESALIFLTPKLSDSTNPREVEVKLARAAAKLVLKINVTNSYTDDEGNEWRPEVDQMWVNFLYARKNTTVAALPVAFDNKSNFIDTAQQTPTSTTAVDAGHTSWLTTPIYTYPQSYVTSDVTAPYYKIFCPWVCDKMGLTNFYYKIILPQLGSFQRNKVYTLTVDLSVIGGTEDWALVTDNIYVADWWAPTAIEASFEGAMYLDVPVKHFDIYGVDDVYIPVRSSNDIDVTIVSGRKVDLLRSSTSTTTQYTTVTPSVSDKTKEGFKLFHHLDDRMSIDGERNPAFDCTPIEYELKVKHTEGGLSKEITVTVTQYPSIYAEADPSNGYAYVNSYTYDSNRVGRVSYGRATSLYNASAYRAFNNAGTNYSNIIGSMNNGTGTNSNYNQYVVHVSVLPDGYQVNGLSQDVVIGDPRGGQLAENNLGYNAGSDGNRNTTVQANYNSASHSTQNVIAPAIRIASSWGASIAVSNFNRAEERCASYQENGYPAGRWRLPTLAEIDFLIRLSEYQHIPALFTTTTTTGASVTGNYQTYYNQTYYSGYWAGGEYLYIGSNYSSNHPFADMDGAYGPYAASTRSNVTEVLYANDDFFRTNIRCVYDEWYWSNQKYGNNRQPSNTAATEWIGYIF